SPEAHPRAAAVFLRARRVAAADGLAADTGGDPAHPRDGRTGSPARLEHVRVGDGAAGKAGSRNRSRRAPAVRAVVSRDLDPPRPVAAQSPSPLPRASAV